MSIQFRGNTETHRTREGETLTRCIRDNINDIDLGFIVAFPEAKPPFAKLLSVLPDTYTHTKIYDTSKQARLTVSLEMSALGLIKSAKEEAARHEHPSARELPHDPR